MVGKLVGGFLSMVELLAKCIDLVEMFVVGKFGAGRSVEAV
jgi:hypothetical protein